MTLYKYSTTLVLVALFVTACGGGGGSGGGGNGGGGGPYDPPPPPANTTSFSVTLNTQEVTSGSTTSGSATANFTLNVDNGTLTGSVTLSGITATNVAIKVGFAGESGTALVDLNASNATTWNLPSNTTLTTQQRDNLNAGQLFVLVTTSSNPDGALRGQILPSGIDLIVTSLSQLQSIPPTGSAASAVGYVTVNSSSGDIAARVVTANFPAPTIAHIHRALAGLTGGVLISLTQDTNDTSLWTNIGGKEQLDAAELSALNAGELYFNFHSAAFLGGEIRGQIVPSGVEVTFTELNGDDVVMAGMSGVTTDASAVAASTIVASAMQLTSHINTLNLDDAMAVTLNQAPAGQNGPSIFDFTHNSSILSRWSGEGVTLSNSQMAALQNQGLYFTVTTPDYPEGEVRGQLITDDSSSGSFDSFQVSAINPANAAELPALPSTATITFNRDVLNDSLGMNTIALTASGGDGSFGDANDVVISGITSAVSTNTITVNFNNASVQDDIFQLSIADNELTDTNGIILDGDGDGQPGGIFASTFSVVTPPTPPNPNATFTAIQNNIFTPICSVCHGGASPSAGMSLVAGQAYNNIVSVASIEQPTLQRINPNNPDISYLIRKLEGGPGISGGRMPLGGPFLSQSVIDDVRQWVSEGAQNN